MDTTSNTPVSQSCGTGLLVGAAEVVTCHPIWVIKTRMQCKYPFTLNPRVLYRGALGEAIAMCPVDMLQMVLSTAINERLLDNREDRSLTKKVIAALIGGGVGGILINGVESVMTLQQKYQLNFLPVLRKLIQEKKMQQLYVGFVEAACRNSIYNCGFLALTPAINEQISKKIHQKQISVLISGGIAGIIVAVISHPFDTIKTIRQESENPSSFRQIAMKIQRTEGVRGFYVGLIPRSIRVVVGIAMMGLTFHSVNESVY